MRALSLLFGPVYSCELCAGLGVLACVGVCLPVLVCVCLRVAACARERESGRETERDAMYAAPYTYE